VSTHAENLSNVDFATALARALATSDAIAVVVVRRDLVVEDANPAAIGMMGEGLVAGADLTDFLVGSDAECLREAISSDASHPDPLLLRAAVAAGDPHRAILASVVAVGEPARFVLVGRSAAPDLRREARILRAQRYEIVGQLTSGVAHDLNNRLSTVTTFSDLMLGDAEPGSQDAEDLAEIKRAGLDAAVITRKLDLFAGGHAGGATETSVPEVVRGFEKLIRRFVGSTITLDTDLDDECPMVATSPIRVEEILIALVSNARDAMPEGGTLTIRALSGEGGSRAAVLEVHDTGTEDLTAPLERALEPFFSSKPQSGGSGLGLATVHSILTELGGSIEMTRSSDGGTRVRVTFPGMPDGDADPAGAAGQRPAGASVGGMKVALIEPDIEIRGALERGLARSGTLVSAFGDVSTFGGDASRWDAVIADVPDHPGAGEALLGAIRGRHATTPVVLLRRRASPCAVVPGTSSVLELSKPTDLETIRDALSRVSGGGAGPRARS